MYRKCKAFAWLPRDPYNEAARRVTADAQDGCRMRSLKWIAAIVLLIAIVFMCVAPSVDLPATVLPGIFLAICFLGLSNALSRTPQALTSMRCAAHLVTDFGLSRQEPRSRLACLLC